MARVLGIAPASDDEGKLGGDSAAHRIAAERQKCCRMCERPFAKGMLGSGYVSERSACMRRMQ